MIYRVPTNEDYGPIVKEIAAEFADELKEIMKRPAVSREEMDRPRFFPSKIEQQE